MTTFDGPDRALYPVDQSFVLQVRRDGRSGDALAGRIEHVASGHAASFETVAELLRFIADSIDTAAEVTRALGAR